MSSPDPGLAARFAATAYGAPFRRYQVLAAWSRWVSRGAHALPVDDPRAQAILALRLGDDPVRVETQLRTLWS
jgi:hypothetical protein